MVFSHSGSSPSLRNCVTATQDSDGSTIEIPARMIRHHRTIVSACLAGAFPPILRFEKREIHKVFLRFPNLDLTKNPTPSHLAKLCGDAIRIICTWTARFVFSGLRAVTSEMSCNITHFYRPTLSLPQKWESVTQGFFYMRCTCFKKSPSRFILQIAIETGTLSQYNGQNTVINAT